MLQLRGANVDHCSFDARCARTEQDADPSDPTLDAPPDPLSRTVGKHLRTEKSLGDYRFGGPADSMSPVALRPFLTEGLPFSSAVTGEGDTISVLSGHYKDFGSWRHDGDRIPSIGPPTRELAVYFGGASPCANSAGVSQP